jgi:flagellum-specific peptidoglycan hydrolase FlgJ
VVKRLFLPVLFSATALVAAGCFQRANVNDSRVVSTPSAPQVRRAAEPRPESRLGAEDPRLDMNALAGQAELDGGVSSIQVLPDGNVTDKRIATTERREVSNTTVTQWVMNAGQTTLWSGADSGAAAFTDLPAGSFFRVIGPEEWGRLPVYYVGDSLLRRPGNGWVEASAVATVEAPAPGQVLAVDKDASAPLPVWVQAHRATTLWSGPDDKAVVLTDMPQWTFLKVAGIERAGRLLVNYAGDYASRQAGIGWVDSAAVGPAGDPGRWVTNHRATALFSGVDSKALRFTELPQWTKLRLVEGAPQDPARLQVEFFGDGSSRQPGTAWVARVDIGPISPPVPLPALAVTQPARSTPTRQVDSQTFASGTDFINAVGTAAQRSRLATGVPASVTVAQAILESDWGRSRLTRLGNNLFGIKALGNIAGPAGVVTLATWEHLDGGDVVVQAPFKAYFTLEQSIDDHGTFFTRNKRYAQALAVASDARAFARAIQDAGYATDPSYASKLIALMDRYNLYRFDN